jgi:hypothetical protein
VPESQAHLLCRRIIYPRAGFNGLANQKRVAVFLTALTTACRAGRPLHMCVWRETPRSLLVASSVIFHLYRAQHCTLEQWLWTQCQFCAHTLAFQHILCE